MPDSLEDFTEDQIKQMAATYQALLTNPETRELTLRGTKKISPHTSIPEIDLKDAARHEFRTRDERQDKLEQEIRERDARDRVRDERTKLREAGHSAEDVAAIEKIMMDEHIPSYETAARYYKGQRTLAEPAPDANQGRPSTYTMPTDAMAWMKGGKHGLRDGARGEASNAINDLRAGRVQLPR